MTDEQYKHPPEVSQKSKDMMVRFQYTIEESSEGVFWVERSGKFSYVNKQASSSLGYTREELLSMHLWDIDPDFPKERWDNQWEELKKIGKRTFETRHRRKDGHIFPVEVCAFQVSFEGKEFHAAFVRDISERKTAREEQAKLEDQLNQAQKLEAIGTLAGGIAHDFNNMLSVIIGYSELLENKISPENTAIKDLMEIKRAAFRSRDIIRQLLTFSRKQVIAPISLNINHQIDHTLKILGRLIGENIELQFRAKEDLWNINLDPSQLDQILINLAVNARDALPDKGGKLRITTSNVILDETARPFNIDSSPGDYVLLAVSDNGTGMDEETLSHVFEPFFTTKETGKGTGLGLATIYGIIKQNNGFIDIHSEPDRGSTFNIYFPRLVNEEEKAEIAKPVPMISGQGTILLVEDDDMVRKVTTKMIEAIGYTVLAASNPLAAILFCETKDVSIDLLLTDVVMPKMTGIELSVKIKALRPKIKVLFMSGYSSKITSKNGRLSKDTHFIEKPFSKNELALKIHGILKGT